MIGLIICCHPKKPEVKVSGVVCAHRGWLLADPDLVNDQSGLLYVRTPPGTQAPGAAGHGIIRNLGRRGTGSSALVREPCVVLGLAGPFLRETSRTYCREQPRTGRADDWRRRTAPRRVGSELELVSPKLTLTLALEVFG
jgi:hypothetical protein